jgi:hypothetical protein
MPRHTQKEKNKRRNKRNKSRRKAQLQEQRSRSPLTTSGQFLRRSRGSRRSASMIAPRGLVANAFSRRMPIGSNHLRGPSGVHGLPLSNERDRPLKPVVLQPIGLAQSIGSLNNTFKRLPAASIPRGQRFLREAVAVPISRPDYAYPNPNPGLMAEQVQRLRPTITRRAWTSELNKETAMASRNAEAGQRYRGIVWAPSVLRENLVELTQEEIDKLIELGKEYLIPGPEIAGYDRYNTIQRARFILENPNHVESESVSNNNYGSNYGSNSNSGLEPETGYAEVVNPGIAPTYGRQLGIQNLRLDYGSNSESIDSNDERAHDLFRLTEEEMQRLREYGEEGQGLLERATAPGERFAIMGHVSRARYFLRRHRRERPRPPVVHVTPPAATPAVTLGNNSNWSTNNGSNASNESNEWSNANN